MNDINFSIIVTQNILVRGPLRSDGEPDDVGTLKAGRHGVNVAAAIEALQETLGEGIVTLETEGHHA